MTFQNNDVDYTNTIIGNLESHDPEVFYLIKKELKRQHNQIELIASENFVSTAVLGAMGSILTNKYAEGYPGARYYAGCENVDIIENIAIERLCKLFGCKYSNVQPHSGASANTSVFYAFLKPGDTFLGMDLAAGGHLTHGAKPTISGKWFSPISYGIDRDTCLINYDEVESIALLHKPKLIIAGGSSYPRKIDFKRFREIADKVGAILMADVAHYSGLIAAGLYPNPFPHAHVVTSTTHKTLRGPRGGVIMWNDPEYTRKINGAVFPGTQGGPLEHVIAAKAVAFGEALKPEFKIYSQNVIDNAVIMAKVLSERGAKVITGGTDSHMVIVDVHSKWGINGAMADLMLEHAGITCNKNAIPFDPLPVKEASGIRIGSPAATTRGFTNNDFAKIGNLIADVLENIKIEDETHNKCVCENARKQVEQMCSTLSCSN